MAAEQGFSNLTYRGLPDQIRDVKTSTWPAEQLCLCLTVCISASCRQAHLQSTHLIKRGSSIL